MGESKHTPGPWLLMPMAYGYDLCVEGATPGGYGGWFVELHTLSNEDLRQEFDANARLIAAAPEMLAALKLAEDVLSRAPFSTNIWPNDMHPNTGIAQIRRAIAKAEGR